MFPSSMTGIACILRLFFATNVTGFLLCYVHEGPAHDADSDQQLGRKIGEQGDGPGVGSCRYFGLNGEES